MAKTKKDFPYAVNEYFDTLPLYNIQESDYLINNDVKKIKNEEEYNG